MSDLDHGEHVTASPEAAWPQALDPILAEAVPVSFVIGRLSLGEAHWTALEAGKVFAAGERVHRQVELVAGGRTVGQGELVNVEGTLGVRILALSW